MIDHNELPIFDCTSEVGLTGKFPGKSEKNRIFKNRTLSAGFRIVRRYARQGQNTGITPEISPDSQLQGLGDRNSPAAVFIYRSMRNMSYCLHYCLGTSSLLCKVGS